MPKYSITIGVQLDKFLGDKFRFQSRAFSVSDCDTKEQAEQECKQWVADYITELVGRRKSQEEKTLTEEMLLEFEQAILKAQQARK